ncbi:hypothetical protein B7C51_25270 (plasmid) [Paenibacillus larvae subsp. pulvifaciens]|uniref:Fibronectin type-III domain-containing protein n=1 Tax=Paenibacillus larvae subsp. pulvifaciens TaxID=1477 RepID=A0A1V0V016_9BACL|nr:hypothetical protein [Paenibacillus larvae]ARF70784.1 hypothetical protein B7C51_25270 [Paenibacillus larvae subsp. pulvifaciens]
MATLSGSCDSNGTITWTISGLGNPANQYDGFSVTTSDGKSTKWTATSVNTGSHTLDWTYNHGCGMAITGRGTAIWDGVSYSVGSATVYTPSCPIKPSGTPVVSATPWYSGGKHYVNISWYGVTAYAFDIYINGWYIASPTKSSYTAEVHSGDYFLYNVAIIPYNKSGSYITYGNTGTTTFRSLDKTPPTITSWYAQASDIGNTSVRMYVTATDSGSGMNGFNFYLDGKAYGPTIYNNGSGYFFTFDGLSPDTSYTFGVIAFDQQLNYSAMQKYTIKTKANVRPQDFSWSTSKLIGQKFNLTANEWNQFINRINEFRAYKNINKFNFTAVSRGRYLRQVITMKLLML